MNTDTHTTRTNNDPATDMVWAAPFGNLAEFLTSAIEAGDQVQFLGYTDDQAETVYIGLGILADGTDPFSNL